MQDTTSSRLAPKQQAPPIGKSLDFWPFTRNTKGSVSQEFLLETLLSKNSDGSRRRG